MTLTPEILSAGVVGAIVVLGAIGQYLRTRQQAPRTGLDPSLQVIGADLGNREQMERLIVVVTRVAVALETIADRKQSEMGEKLDELLEQLSQRAPPRRR